MSYSKSYSIRDGIEPVAYCCFGKVSVIREWGNGRATVHCDHCGKLLKEFKIEKCYQQDDACPVQ